jgi:hypothetical protein
MNVSGIPFSDSPWAFAAIVVTLGGFTAVAAYLALGRGPK